MRRKSSAVQGEYHRVAERISHQAELEKAYFTPLTEIEAEYLVKHYSPNTDVIFNPDIRSTANDSGGHYYIRFCSNLLTSEDIEKGINYPRLQLGVVIHELAHVLAGLHWGHGWKFSEKLDELALETSDGKWQELVNSLIEREKEKKKIAKSISKILESKCPECGKPVETSTTFEDLTKVYHQLKCGHLMVVDKIQSKGPVDNFKSINNEPLYPFQKENNEKFATANGKLAILDEMGLGKTPSSISIAHTYNLMPALVICKSGLRHQWQQMLMYWGNEFDEELLLSKVQVQVIGSSKDVPIAGNDFYVVSYDMLPLLKPNTFQSQKLTNGKLVPLGLKLAIIDECQHMKNESAQRTRAVFETCKTIPNIVFTSGTPIKNNASEFYPMLHLLDPGRFPNKAKFCQEFVDTYMKGPYLKYGGIRNYEKFKEATDKYLIRHTQSEVLPDLPEITRNFIYTELEGKDADEYRDLAKQFAKYYYETSKEDRQFFQNILEFFTKMRHVTGRAKIDETVEYAKDFLESTDRKLAIFTHHIDVREAVVEKLNEWLKEQGMKSCLELVGNMDGNAKEELKAKFNFDASYRILVASTLASGEGHNLQHACSDCVMMERQWNPANEEQAEFRFKRPGQKSSVINATYPVALETIDEYLTKLVENKRMQCKYSLDGVKPEWNQNSIINELAQMIAMRSK